MISKLFRGLIGWRKADIILSFESIAIPGAKGSSPGKMFTEDNDPSEIRIKKISHDFKRNFSPGILKPERDVKNLYFTKLRQGRQVQVILSSGHGRRYLKVSLSIVLYLIKLSKRLDTERSNVFLVPDRKGQVGVVYVDWLGDGWGITCSSLSEFINQEGVKACLAFFPKFF